PAPSVTSTYIKTTANLNMRTGAGTGYAIITTIPAGTKLESLGTSGGWHKVSFSGRTGWVSGSYVTILSGYSQKVIGIPYVNQYSPVYAPMGCEGASLLMALKYKGYASLDLKAFLDAMPKTERDPFNGFASTPYTVVSVVPEIFQSIFPEALTAYGSRYSGNVADVSGYSTAQLKAEIDKGNPVVVYVTTRNYETPVWKVYDMGPSGNVNIVDNMHVMVLTGYNSDGEYHVTDPASSRNTYWVSQVKFETAYNALKWAVVVR
ncbi:MAG: C39 family peptidase, partial [Youngiibacter sp.]|nr:C39 family peptidase [Youngiibacter sp.]